jgi:hypothetical protein
MIRFTVAGDGAGILGETGDYPEWRFLKRHIGFSIPHEFP